MYILYEMSQKLTTYFIFMVKTLLLSCAAIDTGKLKWKEEKATFDNAVKSMADLQF